MANGGTEAETQAALPTGKQLFTPFEQRIRDLGLSEVATENLLMGVENFRVSYDRTAKAADPQRASAVGAVFVSSVNGLAGQVDYSRETKPDARQNVEQIVKDLLIAGTAAFAALAKPTQEVAAAALVETAPVVVAEVAAPEVVKPEVVTSEVVAAAPVHVFKVEGLHALAAKAQQLGASGDLQGMVVDALVQVDKAVTHLRDARDDAGQDHAVEAYAQYERVAKGIARADYADPQGDIRRGIKDILDAAVSEKSEWGTDLLIINQLHMETSTADLALVDDSSPVGGTTGSFRPEKPAAPVVEEVAQVAPAVAEAPVVQAEPAQAAVEPVVQQVVQPVAQQVEINHSFKMEGLRDLAIRAQTLNVEPELKVQVITAMAHLDDIARHIRDGRNEGSQQQAIDSYAQFQKVAKALAAHDYGIGSRSEAPAVKDILAQAVRGTKDGDNPAYAQPWALDIMIARNLHMEQGMSELRMLDEDMAGKARKSIAELEALEKAGAADMEQATRETAAQAADKGNDSGTPAARIVEASENSSSPQPTSAFGAVSVNVVPMAQPNGIDWEVVGETIVADDAQPAKTQAFVKPAEPAKATVEELDKRDKINIYLRTNPYARLEKALVSLNRDMEGTPLAKDLRVALSCVRTLLKDDLALKQTNKPGHVTLKEMRLHTKEYAARLDEYVGKIMVSDELKDFQEKNRKSNLKKQLKSLHDPAMRHADRLQKAMRVSSISRVFSSAAAVFSKFFHHAPAAAPVASAPTVAESKTAPAMKVD